MQMSQLVPASSLAQRFGVKMVGYGPPGSAKTPLTITAPRPVLLACEPGLGSMRLANNVATWEAFTIPRIEEFFTWFFGSNEARNFDTLAIDSTSQMAELYLDQEKEKWKDPRKAYGEMATKTMTHLNKLYYMPQKHIYLICKQMMEEEGGVNTRKPYFPGKELNIKVPHLFDLVSHISITQISGIANAQLAIRCLPTFGTFARDRYGKLAELEQPDLKLLFQKCMS